jgi:hypothetical protein
MNQSNNNISLRSIFLVFHLLFFPFSLLAQSKLLIPMDLKQTDHLKSYGVAYWVLEKNGEVDWLLNYRGGSFITDYSDVLARECRVRGVLFEALAASEAASIYAEVQREDNNQDVVRLEKAPKIAVYAPPGFKPWDDAVTMASNTPKFIIQKFGMKKFWQASLQNMIGFICIMKISPVNMENFTPASVMHHGT